VITPPAPVSSGTFANGGFESPNVGTNNFSAFVYNPTGTAWTFNGSAGEAGNNSGFTSYNAAAPEGTQVGFVQMTGSIEQNVQIAAGTYTVAAQAAQRAVYQAQNQTVDVYVDGNKVGTFAPSSTAYTAVSSSSFTVADGTHNIKFVGRVTADGTLFIDKVTIVAVAAAASAPTTTAPAATVTVSGSGFESPNVGTNNFSAFVYNPTGTAWTFNGSAGVAGNNSGFTDHASNAPSGTQVAFIQKADSAISQTLSFPSAGTYTLILSAASRGGPYNQQLQVVNVYIDGNFAGAFTPSGTNYQTVTLTFNVLAGSHQLSFRGTVAADATAFIDDVVIIGP
jgi:hypothetical protein